MEGTITERHKAFAATHRSDEDHQAYISAFRRASSVIAKAKLRHDRQLVLLFHSNQTEKMYTLIFALSQALLPRFPPLLISQTVFFSRESASVYVAYLRSHFSVSEQRLCVAASEATFLSSVVPRARRGPTRPSALLSPPLNFLRLPPTFPHLLALAQTKLPSP